MFDINIKDNEIANLNNENVIHLKDGLPNDNNTDIEDSGVQHKQDNRHNCSCTLVENELQPNHQLEGQNNANNWGNANKHEDERLIKSILYNSLNKLRSEFGQGDDLPENHERIHEYIGIMIYYLITRNIPLKDTTTLLHYVPMLLFANK